MGTSSWRTWGEWGTASGTCLHEKWGEPSGLVPSCFDLTTRGVGYTVITGYSPPPPPDWRSSLPFRAGSIRTGLSPGISKNREKKTNPPWYRAVPPGEVGFREKNPPPPVRWCCGALESIFVASRSIEARGLSVFISDLRTLPQLQNKSGYLQVLCISRRD